MKQQLMWLGLAVGALIALPISPARSAVTLGQTDSFETANLQSWQAGGSRNPNGPTNILSGGPAGLDDNYLRLRSSGVSGAGGKLVAFNKSQWAGNYLTAQVSSIQMQVSNLGSTDLVLRLVLENTAQRQSLGTITPVNLPAGSGWTTVSFSLAADNLRGGNYNTVLSNVAEFNLVHSTSVITNRSSAPRIAAQLGIDNIVAVPEPTLSLTVVLFSGGLLFAAVRRRQSELVHASSVDRACQEPRT